MSDVEAMWAAYAFSFAALALYLAYLWFGTRRLRRAERSVGIGAEADAGSGEDRAK
jgi:hypothetical protein